MFLDRKNPWTYPQCNRSDVENLIGIGHSMTIKLSSTNCVIDFFFFSFFLMMRRLLHFVLKVSDLMNQWQSGFMVLVHSCTYFWTTSRARLEVKCLNEPFPFEISMSLSTSSMSTMMFCCMNLNCLNRLRSLKVWKGWRRSVETFIASVVASVGNDSSLSSLSRLGCLK